MLKEAVGVGETVTLAQEDAYKKLGTETNDVEFEVIQMPVKKTFGLFGGRLAKVRAYIKVSPVGQARKYLSDIFSLMGVSSVKIDVNEEENGAVFNLSGDGISCIVGRHGEVLDALQYLTGLVANHVGDSYCRVTLDTGNYREKREKTLEALGRNIALKAIRMGRKFVLEPMNPYERRVIHTSVQSVKGASSWSEGESNERHIVIAPSYKNKMHKNGINEKNSSKLKGDCGKDFDYDKDRKKELESKSVNSPLYGRIDNKN